MWRCERARKFSSYYIIFLDLINYTEQLLLIFTVGLYTMRNLYTKFILSLEKFYFII